MTTFHKPIANLVPGFMSLAVAGRAIKLAKPSKKPKKMIKGFTDIMVGTSLIGPTANIVAGI